MPRVLGYIILTVVCLVLMVGTFLYVAAPIGFVRDQVVAAIKRETGRDLIIRGKTSFAFYPNLGVALGDVELSAPPGMAGAPLLKTASLKLNMPILALLQSRVSIKQFVLEKPVVNLRVDANGRESWAFDGLGGGTGFSPKGDEQTLSPELEEFIENSTSNRNAEKKKSSGLAALSLGDVRIIDGTFRYSDARDGTTEMLEKVNMRVGLDSLSAPLTLSGRARWRERDVPFEARIASLAAVLDNQPSAVTVEASPRNMRLSFDGKVDPNARIAATGKLNLKVDDAPAIARWVGGSADAAGPLRAVALAGKLEAGKDAIILRNGGFTINDLQGSANVTVSLNGRKKVTGAISIGEIDTSSFLGGTAKAKKSITRGSDTRTALTTTTGWSSAAIDFKPLRKIDAVLSVTFKSIVHNKLRIGAGKLRLGLDDGLMRIDANPLAVYDGAARGTVVVNARRSIATYDLRIAAERVSARPLLNAVAGLDWLSGATNTRVSVSGRGLSQLQMIRTMSGSASFTFTNGAIEGMNVAKVLRGIQGGQFSNFDRVSGEKTDFSELSASFQIQRGIASNKDLRLLGPLIRATGAGSANIGRRTIDYRLTPKLVASLEGQGGTDLAGLSIPLLIRGPWANPRISPDIGGGLQNPDSAAAAINTIGKAIGKSGSINSDKVKNLLDGVLGGSSDDDRKKKPIGDLLGDFLQQ